MNINSPNKSHIPSLRSLWKEAFNDTDEFLDNFHITAFSYERCRIATVDDQLAAALYWFDCLYMDEPIAYIYAVATDMNFRGQGICHKLMNETHLHLKNLGYKGAILVPGDKHLFSLYESMGYKTCSYINEFSCIHDSEGIAMRSIDKTQYTNLRKQFLPSNSVLQEYTSIDFLATQAQFYAGDDFVIACHIDKNKHTLRGIELLGNTSVAPNVLFSLGCTQGTFRSPDGNIPFAMFYSLANESVAPTYFGLAFD